MQVIGVDEVGRGAWAGPVCVAAVQLTTPVAGLKDSKKLTAHKRAQLTREIKQFATVGIGWSSVAEIDTFGLTEALRLACTRSLRSFGKTASVIIDGNYNFLADRPNVTTLIRADSLVPAVSAASIVAKVARDNLMKLMSLRFPAYGFGDHVGYGTKRHQSAITSFGPCLIHRMSFKPLSLAVAINP